MVLERVLPGEMRLYFMHIGGRWKEKTSVTVRCRRLMARGVLTNDLGDVETVVHGWVKDRILQRSRKRQKDNKASAMVEAAGAGPNVNRSAMFLHDSLAHP